MKNVISGPVPTLAAVSLLNERLIAADALVRQAEQAVRDAEHRRQPLRDRLAVLDAENGGAPDYDPAVVDALVADPKAEPDMAAITEAVSAARQAQDVHNMQKRAVAAAIEKIGLDVAEAERQLEAVQNERSSLWEEFVTNAHCFLVDCFLRQFEELRLNVLEPVFKLQSAKGDDDTSLVKYSATRLGDKIEMQVYYPSPSGGSGHWERLFPPRNRSGAVEVEPISRLRSLLASGDVPAILSK